MAEPIGALYADLRMPTAQLENDLRAAAHAVRGASKKMESGFNGLKGRVDSFQTSIKSMVLGYVGFQAVVAGSRALIGAANQMQQVDTQLKFLIPDQVKVAETQTYLSKTSTSLNVDLLSLSRSYAQLLPLVNNHTVTTEQARKITEGYANAQHALGLANGTISASMVGVSQALSAGVLHMQDFRQVTGQIPGLAQKVAAAMGISFGQLYNDIGKAKISSEEFGQALVKAFGEYSGAADAAEGSINQSLISIRNSYLGLVKVLEQPIAFGIQGIADAMQSAGNQLAGSAFLNKYSDWVDVITSSKQTLETLGTVSGQKNWLADQINQINDALGGRGNSLSTNALRQKLQVYEDAYRKLEFAQMPDAPVSFAAGPQPVDITAQPILAELQITGQKITDAQKRLALSYQQTWEATRTPAELMSQDLMTLYNQWKAFGDDDTFNRAVDQLATKFLPKANIELESLKNTSDQLGHSLVQAFENSILSGHNLLKTVGRLLESVALFGTNGTGGLLGPTLGKIAGGISGFFGGIFRAGGGPVSAGSPYIVGENGPEWFVPSSAGVVLPNGTGPGGGLTVNVDARGATDPAAVEQAAMRAVMAAAPAIMQGSVARAQRAFTRPSIA